MEMLDVVNERDEVIGQESRVKIHQHGLLHREIHVWFVTPEGGVIFQKRAEDKDTWPGKFDATIGGHVEQGATYKDTAMHEAEEETGVELDVIKLVFIDTLRSNSFDSSTGKTNNVFRAQFAYPFSGEIADLRIEQGKGAGFEMWTIDHLLNLSDADREKFIPILLDEDMIQVYQRAYTQLYQ